MEHQNIDPAGGLSPRVRGNPMAANMSRSSAGSIPARAGEPRVGVLAGLFVGVYPRACGGTGRG